MRATKAQHLDGSIVPKRILALDGGGIRGVLTLQYLARIEALLRARHGEDLRMCDYFDLIGGTSTGSIIAAALACGMSVEQIERLYHEIGTSVFSRRLWRRGLIVPKFPAAPLREALDAHLGADTALSSDRIRTGLMIMTKRLDTGSPWPLHNHPAAPYAEQDGNLLLPQIVRASSAAPHYFEPERVEIASRGGARMAGAFVDGGVSPFNDPALQLLMLATLGGHGFGWQTGEARLLLISVGTGSYRAPMTTDALLRMPAAEQAMRALASTMDDNARTNQAVLQWITRCLTPWSIDRAVGDLQPDSARGPRLATYVRYNVLLEAGWLRTTLGLECSAEELAEIAAMDEPSNVEGLARIGAAAARAQVKAEHFPDVFAV
jgi:hypothetical protein